MTADLELFDPTKSFGPDSNGRTQFSTATELLSYMDRLGIARALVYYSEARFFMPGEGNALLLEKLASTPAASNRLFPAAVVSPAQRYHRDALEQLQELMQTERLRALRYFGSYNWNLRMIEPLLEALLPWSPVLFLEGMSDKGNNAITPEELIACSARFPTLPLVVVQTMWSSELALADAMERCPNLHLDISWMHSGQTIEFFVQRFGANRVLFGAGPDSHNGAAIAALTHAEISLDERRLIASGNLQRLLSLEQLAPTGITPQRAAKNKPLWNAYLQGEVLPVEVVDAHAHPTSMGYWLRAETSRDVFAAHLLQRMERIGISTMCMAGVRACFGDALADHEDNETRLAAFGERFRGYVTFNPAQADAITALLDEYFERGYYIGFKLLNDYWRLPLTDEVFTPVWEYSHAHRLPILMHTWVGPNNDPALLRDIAPRYPDAIFILGHSGGSDHGSAIALAQENPNVYLEWCGSFCSRQRWEEVVAAVGADHVLYGSDAIPHNMDWELGRMLSLDLPDETIAPMLGANMRRILALRR